jgi:hypothetical protein
MITAVLVQYQNTIAVMVSADFLRSPDDIANE